MNQIDMDNDLDFPRTILVDTVSFCNLKCSMCPHVNMTRKKGRMDWALFTRIIDEIAAHSPNSRVWLVFFGEPLILKKTKPSIFDMIRYCKHKGLSDVVLNSNGNLLDHDSSRKLLEAGLDEIYIGLDAFSADTYEKVRVGGNYHKTVENVLGFVDTLKEKGLKNYPIYVQFVEMDSNRGEREAFEEFWTSKGVSVKVRKKLTWGGLIEAGDRATTNRHKCYWAMDTISITDQGDVTLCAADPDARYVAGNIREQSISSIWEGRLRDLRTLHREGLWDKLPYPCNTCSDWSVSYEDRLIQGRRDLETRVVDFARKVVRRLKPVG